MNVRSASAIVSVGIAIAVGGCGDSSPAITGSRGESEESVGQAAAGSPSAADRTRGENSTDPSKATRGPRAITKDSGAVYVLPERPIRQTTTPGRGCKDRKETSGGRTIRVSFPPVPGLRATRMGGTVRIDYKFRVVPSRCRPVRLEVTLDVNDDPLPGRSTSLEISSLRGSLRVGVPADLQEVDVARAVARTERRAPSAAAAVPIR